MQLGDFLGIWQFRRRILDDEGHETGHVEGQVTLSGDQTAATWQEEGLLFLAGQAPIVARRTYKWQQTATGIAVLFDDNRPFHDIDFGQQRVGASHWCDPDDYHVAYDFSEWPVWQSDWRVIGPRKDYRLLTRFARA